MRKAARRTWASSATRCANGASRSASSLDQAEEATRIRGKLLGALEARRLRAAAQPRLRARLRLELREATSSSTRCRCSAMYRAETGAGRYHDINLVDDEAVAPRGEQHAVPWKAA